MGYQTTYTIKVANKDGRVDKMLLTKIMSDLEFISNCVWFKIFNGTIIISAKWYKWKLHMKELSLKYPDLQFEVEGEGEENTDIWRAYFQNEKSEVQNAVFTFPDAPDWLIS